MRSAKKTPWILLLIIFAIAAAILCWGLILLSRQKNARAVEVKSELSEIGTRAAARLQEAVQRDVQAVFSSLGRSAGAAAPEVGEIASTLRDRIRDIPFLRFPFLIHLVENGGLLYPRDALLRHVFPPQERFAEITLFKMLQESAGSAAPLLSSQAAAFYETGADREFAMDDWRGGVSQYEKAMQVTPDWRLHPIFLNRIAVCRMKSGDTTAARATYRLMERRYLPRLTPDLRFLRLYVLRRWALMEEEVGDVAAARLAYSRLLRLFRETKEEQVRGAFVFYLHEALHFLGTTDAGPQLTGDLEARIAQVYATRVDGRPLSRQERERTLADVFQDHSEALGFFQQLRHVERWEEGGDYTKLLQNTREGKDYTVFYRIFPLARGRMALVGMVFHPPHYPGAAILDGINRELRHKELYMQFAGETPAERTRNLGTFPCGNRLFPRPLALYSGRADYVAWRVKRDLRLNHVLIGGLLLGFVLFIFLFVKYIIRESELLRLKADFVENVSHTLKTPLTRISLLAEVVANGWQTSEEQRREFLRTIMLESTKANEMIDNMLKFSRLDTCRGVFSFREESLSDVVAAVMRHYEDQLRLLGFVTEVKIDPLLPPFAMDRNAMETLLGNLVHNAIKYSPDEKFIGIVAYPDGNRVVLEFGDHGMGMAAPELGKIFAKYYRVRDERVRATEGSGLGLFLVDQIVRAHRGEIRVTSAPGRGTTFRLSFALTRKGG